MFVRRSTYDSLYTRYEFALERLAKAREERGTAVVNRQQISRQLAEADAANQRLVGRNRRLQELLEHQRDEGSLGMLRQHHDRLERALRACARYMTAYWKARAEIRDLTTRLGRAADGLADLRTRLHFAEERARKAEALLAASGERPIDGAPARRDESAPGQLRRSQAHARALEQRLAEVTAGHHWCKCEREVPAS